jgi:farnesyl-diphosphate farnesyltransferase
LAERGPTRDPVAAGVEPLLDRLLQGSSRTFALNIPLLPEPTRLEVTVAYLLFRVADTIEDSVRWPRSRKLEGLRGLAGFLADPSDGVAARLASSWKADPPLEHPGYLELLAEFPAVMRVAKALSPEARRLVSAHTIRTCHAMSSFVEREAEGSLRLHDLSDLRAYCYAVAGIVGEMLTELFLLGREALRPLAESMRKEAASFGEALQLVNILKDRVKDAGEGRRYLPDAIPLSEVFALARRDLEIAGRYSSRLEHAGADRGIVAFTALPILLARATLDRVERDGPGSRINRSEVATLMARLHGALEGRCVATLLRSARE